MSRTNEALLWRYATKKFDPTKKLSEKELQPLLDALRLSPSSYGLQPYQFILVTDPAIRQKIKEGAWNQPQVTDASHLIVLCARTSIDVAYVDAFVQMISEERGVPIESLKSYRDMMAGFVEGMPAEALKEWMKRQAYIPLGCILTVAAEHRIDACPMEGFDPAKVNEILGLEARGLTSVALCPVGHRAADDATALYKKVRLSEEQLIIRM